MSAYWNQIATTGGIHALAALGLYVAFCAGQFSMGHGILVGVGAYTAALMSLKLGLSFPLAVVLGGMAGALMGVMVALLLSRRLSGLYLAIGTLALAEAVVILIRGWDFLGGSFGIAGIPIETELWHVIMLLVAAVVGLTWFDSTRPGHLLRVVGTDALVAQSIGLTPMRWIVGAWISGGFITGIAGALLSFNISTIEPSDFGFTLAVNFLVIVVLGGTGNPIGTVIAAFFISVTPELFRSLGGDSSRMLFYGTVLLLVVIFRPDGLVSRRGWRRFTYGVGRGLLRRRSGDEREDASEEAVVRGDA